VACGGVASTLLLAGAATALFARSHATPVDLGGQPRATDMAVLLGAVAFAVVGSVILLRRSGNPVGWVFAAIGPAIALAVLAQEYAIYAVIGRPSPLAGGALAAWFQQWALVSSIMYGFSLLFLLFPDGRLLGRRWRVALWLDALGLLLYVAGELVSPGALDTPFEHVQSPLGIAGAPAGLTSMLQAGWMLGFLCIPVGAVSQVLRFRRSHGVERQQVKWLAYAAAALAAAFVASNALNDQSVAGEAVTTVLMVAALAALPSAAGMAILRHRLYEIDVLVNRTLVYGSLSALLAGLYFGFVVLLQLALRPLTAGNGLAVALSTLAAAALVRPARGRIQGVVDRRFYRRKYDAELTLAAFSAALREEVDLEALRRELTAAVAETVQPAHLSLWLRDDSGAVTPAVTIAGRRAGTRKET
jgi:hypothetical protein